MATIAFHTTDKIDIAVRIEASKRQIDRSELMREITGNWLAIQNLPVDEQIKSILTDLLDDDGSKESLDGAVARLKARECEESLDALRGWIHD